MATAQTTNGTETTEKTEINLLNIDMLKSYLQHITEGLNTATKAGTFTIHESHDLLDKSMALGTCINTLDLFQKIAIKQNQVFQKDNTTGEVSQLSQQTPTPTLEKQTPTPTLEKQKNIKVVELD